MVYNPDARPEAILTTVQFEKASFWKNEFKGSFVKIYNDKYVNVIEKNRVGFIGGTIKKVSLPDGQYWIYAFCNNGRIQARPRIRLTLSAGKTHTLSCTAHTKKNFLGIDTIVNVSLELVSKDAETL